MFVIVIILITLIVNLITPKKTLIETKGGLNRPKTEVGINELKLDYLTSLLNEHNFKKADEETLKILCSSTHSDTSHNTCSSTDALSLPDKNLLIKIDNLWSEKSNGQFGFSVQRNIWINVGGTLEDYNNFMILELFANKVNWKVNFLTSQYICPETPDLAKQGNLPCKATLFYKFYILNLNWGKSSGAM